MGNRGYNPRGYITKGFSRHWKTLRSTVLGGPGIPILISRNTIQRKCRLSDSSILGTPLKTNEWNIISLKVWFRRFFLFLSFHGEDGCDRSFGRSNLPGVYLNAMCWGPTADPFSTPNPGHRQHIVRIADGAPQHRLQIHQGAAAGGGRWW